MANRVIASQRGPANARPMTGSACAPSLTAFVKRWCARRFAPLHTLRIHGDLVIPGRCKASNPESRGSGFVRFAYAPERRLQIHHHVIALDRALDGLRHIRPLHHGRARLDIDGIGLGAKPLWVAVGLPGADIELPAVPGAEDDFAEPGVLDLAG